jgi:hypothetical protein
MKHFITSGRVADLLVVIATTGKTDKGKNEISAFIMMKDQVKPVRKIHTYGMRASETSELRFENSKAEILGERGRGREQALTVLDRGRISIAALAVGIAEAAFDRANSYANERKQFGHAIGNFQAIQWMLVDSAMELEASEVMTMHAAHLQDKGVNTTKESAMAKLFASESAVKICDSIDANPWRLWLQPRPPDRALSPRREALHDRRRHVGSAAPRHCTPCPGQETERTAGPKDVFQQSASLGAGVFTLHSYAYEDVEGQSIRTPGAVPDAGSTAMLLILGAAGVAGLRALRDRRALAQ